MPASVTAALGNPSAISALESQFLAAGPPAWFSSLPADAQSYVLALGPKAETILPEIISLEIAAGLTTVSGAAGTGAAATSTPSKGTSIVGTGSNSTITTKGPTSIAEATTGGTSNAASASAKTTASSAKSTSSSSAGAAQVTGAIAAGVIAAGSFLGLALSL